MAPSKNTSTKGAPPKKKTNYVKASAVRQYSQSDHKANRTSEGYASAKKAFNEFATKMQTYAYEELTLAIVDDEDYTLEQMMKEFAGFLFFRYPLGGTALQYLSGVKSCLMKDFEDSRWWKPSMRDEKDKIVWYSSIYRTLEFKLADKCHESGRSLYEKPDGVDRPLLKNIIRETLKKNNPEAILMGTTFATTWSAVGRASELATATWDSMTFDMRELHTDWKQKKTHKESGMRFPCDREWYETCVIHSLGRYLIACRTSFMIVGHPEAHVLWLFPMFVNTPDGTVAHKMTEFLKKLQKEGLVEGMPEKIKISGFRNGASEHMAFDHKLQDVLWGFRGGWRAELKRARGNEIEYLSILKFISRAGLSLAGHEFIDEVPYAPSCDAFMNDDNKDKINKIVDTLFCLNDNRHLKQNGSLRRFTLCMFAVQLIYFVDYDSLVENNIVTSTIVNVAKAELISRQTLIQWGQMAADQWYSNIDKVMGLRDGNRDLVERSLAMMNKQSLAYDKLLSIERRQIALENKVNCELTSLHSKFDTLAKKYAEQCALQAPILRYVIEQMNKDNVAALASKEPATPVAAVTSATPVTAVASATSVTGQLMPRAQSASSSSSRRSSTSTQNNSTATKTQKKPASKFPSTTPQEVVEALNEIESRADVPEDNEEDIRALMAKASITKEDLRRLFNFGDLIPMCAVNFCFTVFQEHINLLSGRSPFGFTLKSSQQQSRAKKVYVYVWLLIPKKEKERMEGIRRKNRRDYCYKNHDEDFRTVFFNAVKKLMEDYIAIDYPVYHKQCANTKKKSTTEDLNVTMSDQTVGILASRLECLEKNHRILGDRGYIYATKGKSKSLGNQMKLK